MSGKSHIPTQISSAILEEVIDALKNIRGWGSVEIFVQDSKIVQIVERNIKKTIKPEETHRPIHKRVLTTR